MLKAIAIKCAIVVGFISCSACRNEECERRRVQLASKWQQVAENAARRAIGAVEGGGSPATWKQIQEKAELVQSSFETPQVTWPAAEKGKSEAEAQFRTLEGAEDVRAFKLRLNEASEAFTSFEKTCR
jgi:hypothetical protein